MKKKILGLLMILCCLSSLLAGFSVPASASTPSEITAKMNQLQNQYPSGTYWNHYSGSSYDGYSVTNTPCGTNGYTCNNLYGGKQCYGFARHIAYLLFGSYPQNVSAFSDGYVDSNGWTCIRDKSRVTLEPGDYVRADNHSGIVWYISGDNIYFAQCWGSSGCKLNWGAFWGSSKSATLSEILSKILKVSGNIPAALAPHTPKAAISSAIQFTRITTITAVLSVVPHLPMALPQR